MRFTLPFLCVAIIGCGNSTTTSDLGMDLSVADRPVSVGDMTGATCDIKKQTGCAATDKCVPNVTGTMTNPMFNTGTCVANGNIIEGAACMFGTDTTDVNDDCEAGLICDNDGPNSANACHKFCGTDADCTKATEKCFALYDSTRSWGFCLPTCTPTFPAGQSTCPAGNDCSANFDAIATTMSSEVGYFLCKMTGTAVLGDQCQADSDCGVGLWCDQTNGCSPICETGHACAQAPGTPDGGATMCNPFTNLTNGQGYCF